MKRTAPALVLLLVAFSIESARLAAAQAEETGEGRVLRAGALLTNDSIVRLVKAGLSDAIILRALDTQPGKYVLEADDLISLKNAGVSDPVLDAMLRQSARGCDPATIVSPEIFVTPPTSRNSPGPLPSPTGGTSIQPYSAPAKSTGQTSTTENPTAKGPQGRTYHYNAGGKSVAAKPQH